MISSVINIGREKSNTPTPGPATKWLTEDHLAQRPHLQIGANEWHFSECFPISISFDLHIWSLPRVISVSTIRVLCPSYSWGNWDAEMYRQKFTPLVTEENPELCSDCQVSPPPPPRDTWDHPHHGLVVALTGSIRIPDLIKGWRSCNLLKLI